MIPVPDGWAIAEVGRGIVLVHPAGADAAAIRYRERAGAPRRLGDLVGELVGELVASVPGVVRHEVSAIERFVTDDGELAAMVSLRVHDTTGVLHVHAAYVITDDFYSVTTGFTRERGPEIRQLVRELGQRDDHTLGVRRRRFEYTPPADWQPLTRGLSTTWLPPGYPDHDTRLLVYPANPVSIVGRVDLASVHARLEDAGWTVIASRAVRMTTRAALAVEAQDVVCRRGASARAHRIAVAFDARYQYPFELSTTCPDEDRDVLDAVIDSITPFAAPIVSAPAFGAFAID
ncbi:MAG: hypothetical protein K8W52_26945 [Deltaproteobacteria bacterium]|nr:hypothetical protein [Deltaproteobacteria bacterium]